MEPARAAKGMPHATARAVGAYGERMAERFLREQGLQILDRNWRCDVGEIDIVARDGTCLVVCEVKTRRGSTFGSPVEAVDWRKLHRLRALAAVWLAAQHDIRSDAGGAGEAADPLLSGVAMPGTGPAGIRSNGTRLDGVRLDDVRVDVVGVVRPRRGACRIEHLVGVVP